MKIRQLEFDFVNQLKKKNWFLEHFRPDIGWSTDDKEDKWGSWNNIWENVCDHIRIGFTLKWKF
jgi:hypothetical protein